MLRKVCSDIEQTLMLENMGLPMNAELPPETEEFTTGEGFVHYPGMNFRFTIESGRCVHFGQQVNLKKLICTVKFGGKDKGVAWVNTLEKFAGPLQWKWVNTHDRCRDWRVHFTLEGEALKCLEMNASNVRNSMDRVLYEDPEHPRHDGW